jgi:hypothetical protein
MFAGSEGPGGTLSPWLAKLKWKKLLFFTLSWKKILPLLFDKSCFRNILPHLLFNLGCILSRITKSAILPSSSLVQLVAELELSAGAEEVMNFLFLGGEGGKGCMGVKLYGDTVMHGSNITG